MRNYTNSPIDLATRRHFGGGGGGGKASSKAAKQQNDLMMAQMHQQSVMAQQQAAQMAASAKAQQEQMQAQLNIMEQSRKDALAAQNAQLEQLKANQVKPDPPTRVDEAADTDMDQRKLAARRQGLRKSILAGESFQDAPLLTGPSTLGA
jgi:hypothetical protein